MKLADMLKIQMGENDADAETIGDYLAKLLCTLLYEGESFSGKRPFGNSGWISELFVPLVRENLVEGALDEDGTLIHYDRLSAEDLIDDMICYALDPGSSQEYFENMKDAEKSLNVTSIDDARTKVSDIEVVGNGDLFKVLSKASSKSQGWMKSTKGMQVGNGCLVQVTTQQKNPDGSYSVAEALTFVPNAFMIDDVNGGRKIKI